MKKLVKSVLAKSPNSPDWEISFGKIIKTAFESIIKPVITDQRFWEIVNFGIQPVQLTKIESTEISSQSLLFNEKSKASSSIFAEGYTVKPAKKFSPRENGILFNNKNNFDSSRNSPKSVETLTQLRRQEPLYPSRSLGDEFLYGKFQLIEKVHHLKDFGISIHGKTPLEVAVEYKNFVDNLAAKPSLLHYPNGTFNKQESVDIRGDLETFSIIGFENNPLYEAKYFISGYPVSKAKYTEYVETGNVGMSRGEERASYKNGLQKDLAAKERERKAGNGL
jgi:hypothetical protein